MKYVNDRPKKKKKTIALEQTEKKFRLITYRYEIPYPVRNQPAHSQN